LKTKKKCKILHKEPNDNLGLGHLESLHVDIDWITTAIETLDFELFHVLSKSHKLVFGLKK
jgi:hypothetical protein